MDLTATAAPLADVLDRLARQTGMKVVYEGPAPRQLVTLSLHGRTPTETVLSVFEGLGVNFALVADPTGARVQTLVVAGTATASSSPSSAAASRPASAGRPRRPFGPPPGASPETVDPAFEEADEEPTGDEEAFPGLPPGTEVAEPSGAPAVPPDPALANPAAQASGRRRAPGSPPPRRRRASPRRRSCRSHSRSRRRRPRVPAGAAAEARQRTEPHAGQPAAAVGGDSDYGRVVGPVEGGRGLGKALPGRGVAGPTGRPTTRG